MTNAAATYYDLFGIAPSFNVDKQALDSAYRKLQQASHPDRFVNQPSEFQRQAVQQTAQNTEAYHTLKSAVQRACYLLTISGADFSLSNYTVSNIDLLMQQMEYREQLNELKELGDFEKLNSFADKLQILTDDVEAKIAALFEQDQAEDSTDLKNHICELQFLNKLAKDLDEVEEYLFTQ